jgi:hypothetical protein
MCVLLGSKVGLVDVPAKLLLVSFALELKVEMNWNQNLLQLLLSFFLDIDYVGGQYELFIYGFVQCRVPGSSRVQILQPLSQCILNLNVVPLNFSL